MLEGRSRTGAQKEPRPNLSGHCGSDGRAMGSAGSRNRNRAERGMDAGMSTELAERPVATIDYAALEKLLLHGDTSELGPAEKINYYEAVCKHVGLDWLTQPFRFMKTHDGKEQLYPTKECAAQLRRIHHLDTKIIDEKIVGECYVVRARVQFPSGRGDEDNGAVNLAGLKGQALADAMMKCATKAKRRATLSACGLGMLDSSEVETIPGVRTFSLEEATKDVAATAPPPVTAADTPKLSGPTVTFLDTGTGEEVTVPKPTPKFPYYVCSYKLWPNGWHEY